MNHLRLINVKPEIEVVNLADGAIVRTMRGHHVSDAVRLGTTTGLRAADALYAATAARSGDGVLVSWDLELIERAGAVTPPAWLSTHA